MSGVKKNVNRYKNRNKYAKSWKMLWNSDYYADSIKFDRVIQERKIGAGRLKDETVRMPSRDAMSCNIIGMKCEYLYIY